MNNIPLDYGKNKTGAKWLRSWRCKLSSRKVFSLTDAQYRFWDMCLCATDGDGNLPSAPDLAFTFRMSEREVSARILELVELRFIDPIMTGATASYRMHDWEKWQRKCDADDATVAGRMKRYRKRLKQRSTVTPTVTVTENRSESVSSSESLSLSSKKKNVNEDTYTRDANAYLAAKEGQ